MRRLGPERGLWQSRQVSAVIFCACTERHAPSSKVQLRQMRLVATLARGPPARLSSLLVLPRSMLSPSALPGVCLLALCLSATLVDVHGAACLFENGDPGFSTMAELGLSAFEQDQIREHIFTNEVAPTEELSVRTVSLPPYAVVERLPVSRCCHLLARRNVFVYCRTRCAPGSHQPIRSCECTHGYALPVLTRMRAGRVCGYTHPAEQGEDTVLFDTPTKGLDASVEFIAQTQGTTFVPVTQTVIGSSTCVPYEPNFCFQTVSRPNPGDPGTDIIQVLYVAKPCGRLLSSAFACMQSLDRSGAP